MFIFPLSAKPISLGLSGRPLARIGALFSSLAAAIVHRHLTLSELSRFDERLLSDIGLGVGDVPSALAEPMWRDPTLQLASRVAERRAARAATRAALLFEARYGSSAR